MSDASTSSSPSPSRLLAAFSRFNNLSTELADAYSQLEYRVAEFNRSVRESRYTNLQERAEKERLAERLSRLLEALPAAVIVVDGRGRVDQFNDAAQILLPSLRWGRRWGEVLTENLEVEFSADGWLLRGAVHVGVTRRPLGDEGEVLVLVDQTERRLLEARVHQQERLTALGEMAARLAHQVRTPLSAAVLYAEQLSRDDVCAKQRQRFGEKLSARLRHTEQVVADMLAFARGDRFRPEVLVLQHVVQEALDIMAPKFRAAGGALRNQGLDISEVRILGNREVLTGALVNLFDNALVHGGECVRTTIDVVANDSECQILIEDNGPGIADAMRARVFEPFFTTSRTGTGLGLAVVQAVILEHGGRMACLEGPGGRFEIVLPLAPATGDLPCGSSCV